MHPYTDTHNFLHETCTPAIMHPYTDTHNFECSFSQSDTSVYISLDVGVWNILRNVSGLVTCVTSVDWHAHFKSPWCTQCVASVNWHTDSKHIYTGNLYRLAHVSNLDVRNVHPLMYLSRLVHTVFAYSLWRAAFLLVTRLLVTNLLVIF